MKKDFLLYVEDPGALNLIIDLPNQLEKHDFDYEIISSGFASKKLKEKNIKSNFVNNKKELLNYLNNYSFKYFLISTSENRDSLGLFLIDYSKQMEIMSIGLVDMVANYKYRFSGNSNNPLRYKPDKIIATDKLTKNAFLSLGMKFNDVSYCNHPQIERIKYQKRYFSKKRKSNNLKNQKWLFISENIDELNPSESFYSERYLFSGRGDSKWRTGIILEEIIDALKIVSPDEKLTVRLHPKNNKDQFSKWRDEIKFDEIIDPIESVLSSDIILGMSSNLLVESMICQKPVLSILPRLEEKKWLSELNFDLIKAVFNRIDLIESLKSLADGKYDAFNKYYELEKRDSLLDIIFSLTGLNSN